MARIYLDNQATTPTDPKVVAAMMPYFSKMFGNPHSNEHAYGWQADEAIRQSRGQVARLLNADDKEIVFTSGATESVNIALQGVAKKSDGKNKIVTASTEHPCVLECCDYLESVGFEIVKLPVQQDGLLNLQDVSQAIDEKTLLVSIMLANNEIGVIQPISEIAEICKKENVILHTDATQAIGKIAVDVDELGVDLLSLSGHKIYGPNGVGVLYIRKGIDKKLEPIIYGGGQERKLRPGTLPVALIVGLGVACEIAFECLADYSGRVLQMQKKMLAELRQAVPNLVLFGSEQTRIPGNLNLGFPNISGNKIVEMLGDKLAVSTGSACSSVELKESHVIEALGLPEEVAKSGVRVSIGRTNNEKEIEKACEMLLPVVLYIYV